MKKPSSEVLFFWGRMDSFLENITAPIEKLVPSLLENIAIDLKVDRLGLYVPRDSGENREFVLKGLFSGLEMDQLHFNEANGITYDPNRGPIQATPTEGVGWDLILVITPPGHTGKINDEDVRAILAIDDTTSARRFSKENLTLISLLSRAMRSFFDQREIMAAYRDKDPKTGLLNYNALCDRVSEIEEIRARRGQLYSVGFLDLDHFGQTNKEYGEPFADVILVTFARELRDYFRSYDIVVRYGGEEFVVIINDLGEVLQKRVEGLLKRMIRMKIEENGSKKIGVRFSGGVVDVDPEESIEEAIERASKLKNKAKKEGRGKILRA